MVILVPDDSQLSLSIAKKFFIKTNATFFIWDKSYHLPSCLHLMEPKRSCLLKRRRLFAVDLRRRPELHREPVPGHLRHPASDVRPPHLRHRLQERLRRLRRRLRRRPQETASHHRNHLGLIKLGRLSCLVLLSSCKSLPKAKTLKTNFFEVLIKIDTEVLSFYWPYPPDVFLHL